MLKKNKISHESDSQLTEDSFPFNFNDTYFTDDAITKLKDLGFNLYGSDISSSNFNFNENSSLPSENSLDSWLLKLENFYDLNLGKIKILHLNIDSIFCKLHEFNTLLDKGFFDFIFLQETKLDPNLPDAFLKHRLYNMLRRDHKAGGGGLIAFYKNVIR